MVDKTREPMELIGRRLKQASLLWLEGFGEASCLRRVVSLCSSSRKLSIRTGRCFLLNGFVFLGRYNDIAMHGYAAMERNEPNLSEPSSKNEVTMPEEAALQEKPDGLGRSMLQDLYLMWGRQSILYFLPGCTSGTCQKWIWTGGWTFLKLTGLFFRVLEALVFWPFSSFHLM